MRDDLISRQAVKDWLLKWQGYLDDDMIARMQCRTIDIPSSQHEEKTGRWSIQMLFDDGYGGKKVGYICSACRKYVPFKGDYCGNCGAKMES